MGIVTKPAATTIRGLDPELYKEARKAAITQGITVGDLINRAIAAYLKSRQESKDQNPDH